jgi:hypothetical protein
VAAGVKGGILLSAIPALVVMADLTGQTLPVTVRAAVAVAEQLTAAMEALAMCILLIGNLTDGNHRTVLGQREH